MKSACQLFSAVRERLIEDPALREILDKRVYFNLPERPAYPCVVFVVDEIIDNNDTCRILFNLQLLFVHQKGCEPLKIGHMIQDVLEEGFSLSSSIYVACCKVKAIIDLPLGHKTHAIQHFYKALLWRN